MGEVTLLQYLLVAATAFIAATIGGVTGYGTGLLMPLVLIPIIGPEGVVPVIGISALMTNATRLIAFRGDLDVRTMVIVSVLGVPTCVLGAVGYTMLSGPSITILIGSVLIILVPVRYAIRHYGMQLSQRGIGVASVGYGLVVGGTAGAGVLLIAILMSAGLRSTAVIATDAAISLWLGVAKTAAFQTAGALTPALWIMALLIGTAGSPGAFIGRALVARMPIRVHTMALDTVVIVGGSLLIVQGLRAV